MDATEPGVICTFDGRSDFQTLSNTQFTVTVTVLEIATKAGEVSSTGKVEVITRVVHLGVVHHLKWASNTRNPGMLPLGEGKDLTPGGRV